MNNVDKKIKIATTIAIASAAVSIGTAAFVSIMMAEVIESNNKVNDNLKTSTYVMKKLSEDITKGNKSIATGNDLIRKVLTTTSSKGRKK